MKTCVALVTFLFLFSGTAGAQWKKDKERLPDVYSRVSFCK
jgi:hypothetical protein